MALGRSSESTRAVRTKIVEYGKAGCLRRRLLPARVGFIEHILEHVLRHCRRHVVAPFQNFLDGEHELRGRRALEEVAGATGAKGLRHAIFALGSYIGVLTLLLFQFYVTGGPERAVLAQTVAFTGIIVIEKMNVFNFRSLEAPMRTIGFFTNKWVLLAWVFTLGLQVCAVYVPFLQRTLHTVPLGLEDWAVIVAAAVPIFLIAELHKWQRSLRVRELVQ